MWYHDQSAWIYVNRCFLPFTFKFKLYPKRFKRVLPYDITFYHYDQYKQVLYGANFASPKQSDFVFFCVSGCYIITVFLAGRDLLLRQKLEQKTNSKWDIAE